MLIELLLVAAVQHLGRIISPAKQHRDPCLQGVEMRPILASSLASMLWEAGSLFGLAFAVYLLAPAVGAGEESTTEPAA